MSTLQDVSLVLLLSGFSGYRPFIHARRHKIFKPVLLSSDTQIKTSFIHPESSIWSRIYMDTRLIK